MSKQCRYFGVGASLRLVGRSCAFVSFALRGRAGLRLSLLGKLEIRERNQNDFSALERARFSKIVSVELPGPLNVSHVSPGQGRYFVAIAGDVRDHRRDE